MIGSRFISSSSARPVRRWLPALLYVAAFVLGAATQWPSTGFAQTLGIDCDQPRRNGDGKLILSDDGLERAKCEADRATALNYAAVVRETRDRLRTALAGMPPPLWDDLVEHLRDDDAIADWAYTNTDVMGRDGPPSEDGQLGTLSGRARYWAPGILEGTTYPAEWRGSVRAQACGVDADGTLAPGAAVLVWLDPSAIRDRWTPTMVQRAARAWLQRTEGRGRLVDRIPDIVTDNTGRLWRYDGAERNMPAACLGIVPEDTLAMRLPLHRDIETGRDSERCKDPQVGIRRLIWARHNGVYIVPENAILEDRSPHPDRGDPLLDPPVTDEAAAWHLVSTTCRDPLITTPEIAKDCRDTYGGRFDYGTRKRTPKTVIYPEGWPVDKVTFHKLEDDCFRQVEQTGFETREIACPAGHSGERIEQRSFRWWNRDWAVPSRHDDGREGDRTFDQALAAYRADPAQAGKEWYDTVVLVRDWHLDRLTCTAPRQVTDTQTRTGTCPAGQTGRRTERRTLSWYNRDPGATPPHVITDREVAQAAAAYDANPSQAGLAWYEKVTATQWATHLSRCRVPTPPTPSTPTERTCGNTCAERGGIAGRNSGGEYCRSPKLPKCSRSGGNGNGGNSGGDRDDPSQDLDNDGYDHRTDVDDNDPSVGCGCGEGEKDGGDDTS